MVNVLNPKKYGRFNLHGYIYFIFDFLTVHLLINVNTWIIEKANKWQFVSSDQDLVFSGCGLLMQREKKYEFVLMNVDPNRDCVSVFAHTELKVQIKLQFCEAVVRTLCLKLLPYLVNKNRVHTSTSSPTTLKMRTANITGSETYKGQKDVSVLPPRCHRYIHIHQKLHNMTDSVFYNHIPT